MPEKDPNYQQNDLKFHHSLMGYTEAIEYLKEALTNRSNTSPDSTVLNETKEMLYSLLDELKAAQENWTIKGIKPKIGSNEVKETEQRGNTNVAQKSVKTTIESETEENNLNNMSETLHQQKQQMISYHVKSIGKKVPEVETDHGTPPLPWFPR